MNLPLPCLYLSSFVSVLLYFYFILYVTFSQKFNNLYIKLKNPFFIILIDEAKLQL